MQPEERKMLERLLRISEDNNRILRRMRRAVIFGRVLHFMYVLIVLSIMIGSYYYLKPYLGSITNAFQIIDQYKNIKLPR